MSGLSYEQINSSTQEGLFLLDNLGSFFMRNINIVA